MLYCMWQDGLLADDEFDQVFEAAVPAVNVINRTHFTALDVGVAEEMYMVAIEKVFRSLHDCGYVGPYEKFSNFLYTVIYRGMLDSIKWQKSQVFDYSSRAMNGPISAHLSHPTDALSKIYIEQLPRVIADRVLHRCRLKSTNESLAVAAVLARLIVGIPVPWGYIRQRYDLNEDLVMDYLLVVVRHELYKENEIHYDVLVESQNSRYSGWTNDGEESVDTEPDS